jgi:hypothetical protein
MARNQRLNRYDPGKLQDTMAGIWYEMEENHENLK